MSARADCWDGEEQVWLLEILQSIHVGLIVWELDDPDDPLGMRLVLANPASEEATGLVAHSVVGRTMRELFPAADAAGDPATLVEVALGGEARDLGTTVYSDERIPERTFSLRGFPLAKQRVGVAFSDVTSERMAEARALEVLESMTDAFYAVDHEWRYTYQNPVAGKFTEPRAARFDLPLEERPTVWELAPGLVGTPLFDDLHRAARERVTVEGEYHLPSLGARQPERWVLGRIYPNPSGLSVYVQDITERRQLEAQLLQAQKLESIGLLAGGIAHDMNNLLTVIAGYAALIETEDTERTPVTEQGLAAISSAAARATALTAKLLAFSRTQTEFSAIAEVSVVVGSALDLVASLVGENIAIERQLDPDAGHVAIDITHLEQVIVNLVINARDAIQGSGTITVATRPLQLDDGEVTGLQQGSYATITIADNGCGMDDATTARIFEPFFTTKPPDHGTGLGLSSAWGTITQSGGHIAVDSRPGQGSTFTIYLPHTDQPITRPAATVEPGPPATMEPGPPAVGRVLLVEDEEAVRTIVATMLTARGYTVVVTTSPEEARRRLAAEQFDLMVTDVVMPGEDGPTLAQAAVATHPGLPILFISGYAPSTPTTVALEGSPTAYLRKPFTAAELARSVHELLN